VYSVECGGGLTAKISSWKMENYDLKAMSVDQLWRLHEQIVAELGRKIEAEKVTLEYRLRTLGLGRHNPDRKRRAYPKVLPKYRNPKNRAETWAGRGKQPLWLSAQLRSGKKLEDFLIRRSSAR
jgi:DNA-binding protein H-NS